MPCCNKEILLKYHEGRKNGTEFQINMDKGMPRLKGVSLKKLKRSNDSTLLVTLKSGKVVKMSLKEVLKNYLTNRRKTGMITDSDLCLQNMMVFDDEGPLTDVTNLENVVSRYAVLRLDDLSPLPARPFQDKFSVGTLTSDALMSILYLILSWVPYEEMANAQLVCRRFQYVIRQVIAKMMLRILEASLCRS